MLLEGFCCPLQPTDSQFLAGDFPLSRLEAVRDGWVGFEVRSIRSAGDLPRHGRTVVLILWPSAAIVFFGARYPIYMYNIYIYIIMFFTYHIYDMWWYMIMCRSVQPFGHPAVPSLPIATQRIIRHAATWRWCLPQPPTAQHTSDFSGCASDELGTTRRGSYNKTLLYELYSKPHGTNSMEYDFGSLGVLGCSHVFFHRVQN